MPQRPHTWNSAVRVPCAYFDMSAGSFTVTSSAPLGYDVHTPPCLTQNEQPQARACISFGLGSHASAKAMLPQWHLPRISMRLLAFLRRLHEPPSEDAEEGRDHPEKSPEPREALPVGALYRVGEVLHADEAGDRNAEADQREDRAEDHAQLHRDLYHDLRCAQRSNTNAPASIAARN